MTVIDTAISNLYAHDWTRGTLQSDEGAMCLLGALGVQEDEYGEYVNLPIEELAATAAFILTNCESCREFSNRVGYRENLNIVYTHNDECLQDREEAVRLLKEVAND